jgi:hypothetical protein
VDWIGTIEQLYSLSKEFTDPRDAVAIYSSGGPLSYFKTILGDKAEVIRAGIGWTDEQLSAALRRGIRFAQELCYCRDWDTYKPIEIKPCPFGRSTAKLIPKITAAMCEPAAPSAAAAMMNEDYGEPEMAPTPDPFLNSLHQFSAQYMAAEPVMLNNDDISW